MTLDHLKRVNLADLLTRAWKMSFCREGSSFKALSPFNEETKASFYAAVDHDGHWVWCDHSDGSSGSIIDLMMRRLKSNDFHVANAAACKLVKQYGMNADTYSSPKIPAPEEDDWEWLYEKLRANDATPCLEYLTGRGLDQKLVEQLIKEGIVVLNPLDGSRYCCFAVRDATGKLQSLFNRLIDGPAKRNKFLLGRQHAFCLNWEKVAGAKETHLCESIIDALSISTLEPTAVVLAVPGASFDLSRLELPARTQVIEAFDDDKAGRSAAACLRKLRPDDTVQRFDLHGCHDVNEWLMKNSDRNAPNHVLTPDDRIAISFDTRPSRDIAEQYGVHHSYVCKIRREAADLLQEYWQNKSVGRNPAPPIQEDVQPVKDKLIEQTKRGDLLSMRNDWLTLQLKFHEERDKEVEQKAVKKKRKKKSPKEKTQIIEMIEEHDKLFPSFLSKRRLEQVDLSPAAYARLIHSVHERAKRESVIMDDEVEAAVQLIIKHPNLGAEKLHATLIDQEKALISTTFLNDAKQEIARASEAAYTARREEEKLLQAALRKRFELDKHYQHIKAEFPHHIWAIDFVYIDFLGYRFCLCVLYDIFSQGYLSILAGGGCTEDLAVRAIEAAVASVGKRASNFVRRDNGKAFITINYQKLLAGFKITDQPIPPGSPWFNGSLESNNTGLKSTIKATGMQEMANTPDRFEPARKDSRKAHTILQQTCNTTRHLLNETISRTKFGMPPQKVMDNRAEENRQRQEGFIEQKKADRKTRMSKIRKQKKRKEGGKTFIEKVCRMFSKTIKDMSTDHLYVLNQIIHGRYKAIET